VDILVGKVLLVLNSGHIFMTYFVSVKRMNKNDEKSNNVKTTNLHF
jgi:hypothetical protein